jgi:hypothetical protein
MANRNLNEVQAFEKKLAHIFGSVVITTAGGVYRVKGLGVSGVVRNSTGNYTITLEDKWCRFISFAAGVTLATASAIARVQVWMAPATLQATFIASRTIDIQCLDYAGAPADPEDGSVLSFHAIVRNTTVGNAD